MSRQYKQNHSLNRISLARRENREKGPTSPLKCPVVSGVTSGPPIPTQSNGQQMAPVIRSINGQSNGQQMAPVVSPTNGQSNGRQMSPVIRSINGQSNGQQMAPVIRSINGQQMAPVVSPTNGRMAQLPGRARVASSKANNGAWSMIQQGGRDSQAGMWSTPTMAQAGIFKQDPEARTSIGQITQAAESGDQINLNEAGESYLGVDSDGRIILVRNNMNYHLAGDEQGRIPIRTDGQCGVWIQIVPDQSSSPSIAQMIRGQEGGQIINGMQSGPVAPQNGQTSSRPSWYQQQLPTNTEDWYASQW